MKVRFIKIYTCKCGREFEKKQSYVAHCGHCKVHIGHEPEDRFGDSRAWSRGKTKETDPRIMKISNSRKESCKGEKNAFFGKHHSEETRRIMSEKASFNAKNRINGWKSGDSHVPNKYESFTRDFLISKGIEFAQEVNIPQSMLGKKGSYYQLDFLVGNTIDLEIDGSSHDAYHDKIRDDYISKKYEVYRIQHNDSISELEHKLTEFVDLIC